MKYAKYLKTFLFETPKNPPYAKGILWLLNILLNTLVIFKRWFTKHYKRDFSSIIVRYPV